jgi:hypothetical protein
LEVGPAPEQPVEPPVREEAAHPFHSELPADDEPPDLGRRRSEPAAEPPDEGLEATEVEEPPPLPPRGRRGRPAAAAFDEGGLFEDEAPGPADVEVGALGDETTGGGEDAPDAGREPADGTTDEQTGKRRRRRRSRRKKKPDESVAEGGVESTGEPTPDESPAPIDEDDEEEPTAEVVRNWNVPSWDELIGSLYRPER